MVQAPSIYSLLVKDPGDALSALAYCIYKQQKTEALAGIVSRTGQPATQAHIEALYSAACTPAALSLYKTKATALISQFMAEAVSEHKKRIEVELSTSRINQQFDVIITRLNEKRTFKRWLADVGANLIVTFGSILIIAGLVFGYQRLSSLADEFGLRTGVLKPQTLPLPRPP